ncbi:MAG: GlsB/YeaQ/YmgE family stress response membrane protein [Bacteroidota bacterium]
MSILWSIVIGFLAGTVAKILMPGKDPGGLIVTTLLGIGGAVVATLLGRFFGWYEEGEFAGFLAAVVGALVILALYRAFRRRKSSS